MKTQTSILTLVVIVIIGVGIYFSLTPKNSPVVVESQITETQASDTAIAEHPDLSALPVKITTQNPPVPSPKTLPYGNASLRLGEVATFKNISIRPLSIEEDSRCPVDVQCIQAGTVRVKIQVVSSQGMSTSIVKLGQRFSTEGVNITLTGVSPNKNSQVQVSNKDYVLVFNVVPQGTPVVKNPQNKCYVGGCSSQLCTNQPNAVSTCEYAEKYACYKTATCETQPNGECGWTPTPTLNACLAK